MNNQAMPSITIRDFRPADLPRLHEIDSNCFEQGIAYTQAELALFVRHKRSIVRVAERETGIVGFAIGSLDRDRCGHVITIDVLPQARRTGIGAALLSTLHEEFSKAAAVISHLEVDVDNTAAQTFYRGFGYQRTELLSDYYGPGKNAYQMACRLSVPPGP
jgi:[ribosomal protein S18]-alanine N-acetyltransferase